MDDFELDLEGEEILTKNEDKLSLAKEALAQEVATTTIRNFRQSPDIEGFYRFVDEHGLRREAQLIFDRIYTTYLSKKKKKGRNI